MTLLYGGALSILRHNVEALTKPSRLQTCDGNDAEMIMHELQRASDTGCTYEHAADFGHFSSIQEMRTKHPELAQYVAHMRRANKTLA